MAKRVKTNYDRGYVNAMDKIQIERECDREETIRFENLKRTGHI